ncbi:hypothetical protein ACIOJ9_39685 [Streptomyces sp. NPDC088175]|uniref:hypothetical protein n=1 Tax=unclassified Streptomyces TaxID=2593676 RepID=UPI0038278358
MASFDHATPERRAQLGRALTEAGLTWSDNGQNDPQYLTYAVTDSRNRTWQISPATNFQISRSNPAQIWQASCEKPLMTTRALSAQVVADRIKNAP